MELTDFLFNKIIFVFLVYIWYVNFNHPIAESLEYKDIKDKVKTGDLILFHGLDNPISIGIGSYYTHIGIVYIDPDTKHPYIFEAFNYDRMPFYPDKCERGIIVADLEHRLDSYRGYCFYKELNKPIEDVELLYGFQEFIDYALKNMYYETAIFSSAFGKILCNNSLTNGTNCGELVYLSLIKLGLIPYDYINSNRAHHILWLCKLTTLPPTPTNSGYYYNKPVYILSNYFHL